jgi:hypothetical protein
VRCGFSNLKLNPKEQRLLWNFAKPYLNESKEKLIKNLQKLRQFYYEKGFQDLFHRLFGVGHNPSLSNLVIQFNLADLDLTSENYLIYLEKIEKDSSILSKRF